MRIVATLTTLVLAAIACTPPPPGQSPSPVRGAGPSVAAAPAAPAPGAPGGAGGPERRREPPNPMRQDTARRALVDSIMRTIAGRENEPAGTVFKNVTNLKAMPAGEFLKTMDTQYGRGLGWTCNNCHVMTNFSDDARKNKRIAKQMQEMQDHINVVRLASVKELDAKYDQVSCVMCHRGANEPKGTMPVLPPTTPTVAPGKP